MFRCKLGVKVSKSLGQENKAVFEVAVKIAKVGNKYITAT